jgi:hypothetical protein
MEIDRYALIRQLEKAHEQAQLVAVAREFVVI